MRVLCLTNMWPTEAQPDYGAFVAAMCGALEARGVAVEVAAIEARGGGPLRTPTKYGRLAATAARRAHAADVIYAHYLFPTGAIAAAAGGLAGTPWVLTAHGGDVANLSRGVVRAATDPGLRGASGIIAVSGYLAEELAGAGVARGRIRVINMGVDLERFAPRERGPARARLGLPPDGEIILAVGGLTDRKNPLTLLQAVERLRATRPGVRLALVGSGPLAAAVGRGAERLGLTDLVAPGAVPHDEVADWMAAADVLAMVSRVEPLGQVALEALAVGRPVVATAVGGAREVVPDHGPGRIVDPLDPARIAAALDDVLARPPAAAECRAAAAPYALSQQAARVESVLADACRSDGETTASGNT